MRHLIRSAAIAAVAFGAAAYAGGSHSKQADTQVQRSYKKLPDGYRESVVTKDTKPSVKVTVEQKGWKQWAEKRNAELSRLRAENEGLKSQVANLQNQQSLQGVAEVKQDARGLILTLTGGVLFESGSAELMPDAQKRLDSVAEVLSQAPDAKFTVEGHTDSQGTAESNKDLSERRAAAVKDYFVSKGISDANIDIVGHGEEMAVASNASPEGRANNRRVEVVIPEGTLGIGGSGQSSEEGMKLQDPSEQGAGEDTNLEDPNQAGPLRP